MATTARPRSSPVSGRGSERWQKPLHTCRLDAAAARARFALMNGDDSAKRSHGFNVLQAPFRLMYGDAQLGELAADLAVVHAHLINDLGNSATPSATAMPM